MGVMDLLPTFAKLAGAEALIIDPALVSDALLDRAPGLKFLQLTSTDLDDLDLAGLEERGITIAGVNEAAAPAAATHVLDLAVTAARLIGHPGVNGVPTFIVANKHVITGAQPPEMWTTVLEELSVQAETDVAQS